MACHDEGHWSYQIQGIPCTVDVRFFLIVCEFLFDFLSFSNLRCPADDSVQFHKTTGRRQRFGMQAFRYLQNSTAVYVHCVVFLCHQTSSNGRCVSGCHGNNINRVKRDLDGGFGYADKPASYSKYYLIEAGPITLSDGEAGNKRGNLLIPRKTNLFLMFSLFLEVLLLKG